MRTSRSLLLIGAALVAVPLAAGPVAAADLDAVEPGDTALTITSPADGALITGTAVTITGTKAADTTVELSGPDGSTACLIEPGTETWSCDLTVPAGAVPITALERPAAGPPASATVNLRVLLPPVIAGVDPQLTTGAISGTGLPGAFLTVTGSGPESIAVGCGTAGTDGTWACVLPVSVSGTYTIAVQQSWPGSPAELSDPASRTLLVDRDPPGLAVITAPTAGGSVGPTFVVSGTGEAGGRVEVFVDSQFACASPVSGGVWSCTVTSAGEGARSIRAIQWDAAGNPGGSTAAVPVTVTAPAPDTGEAVPPPADQGTVPPGPPPAETGTGNPPAVTEPPTARPESGFLPPPIGGRTELAPMDTWDLPTGYGATIPHPASLTLGWGGGWLNALLTGAAFLVLIAIPLRLLRGRVLGPRLAIGRVRLTGRNRRAGAGPSTAETPARPWLIGLATLAAAGALTAVAGGIQAEARFIRLAVAALIGVAVLNALSVLAARIAGATLALVQPRLLLIAAVLALGSRALGVQPPVVFAIVLTAGSAVVAGRVAGAQLATPWALGVIAWLLHTDTAGPAGSSPILGFWPAAGQELLAVLVVAGLGSALILTLPVGRLPGRVLADRSPLGWAAATLAVAATAAAVLAQDAALPLGWIAGLAVAFAAVVYASWIWLAYVPASIQPRRLPER